MKIKMNAHNKTIMITPATSEPGTNLPKIQKKDIMKATVAKYQPEYKNLFNKEINF